MLSFSMPMLRLVTCGFAVLLLQAAAAECLAQPSRESETSSARTARLQRHVDEATRAFGAGQYEAAIRALRAAEAIAEEAQDTESLAAIRFNIARCLQKLGREAEALEAYRLYDELPDLPHRKRKAFSAMERLEAAVLGVMAVTCQQEDATIVVPRISEASLRCPFRSRGLQPGDYEIEVSAPGFARMKRSVQVRPGATTAVDFDLSPLPAAPPTRRPSVALETATPAVTSGDGVWPWVTMGAGAAALGVGGIFHALAISAGDDASVEPPTARRDQLVSDFESNRDLAYVFYGVGGAVAVAGIVWKVLEITGGRDEQVALQPTPNGFEVRF